ncbi:MAG TPA: DUF885 domain-containing protein [Candidatus Udaeobacter sp.]|jgi:uncharacterized protein (DUF885 family)|nr:DUF885 domain-containing protein [Candidatus Udaeobacter sp.]
MIETERAFSALREEFVEVSLRDDPVAATRAGLHDYDGRFPDHSPDGIRARSAWLRDLDQRLVASVPWEELPVTTRVEFADLRSRLAAERARLDDLKTPSSHAAAPTRVALEGVELLANRSFAPLEERKEFLLERLMAIPDYLEGARLPLQRASAPSLELAQELGLAGPAYLESVVRQLLNAFPDEAERIEHAGERARVGLLRHHEFLEREIRPRGEAPFAIGERWFQHLLEREHLLSLTAAAIRERADAVIEECEKDLAAEAQRLDPKRTWQEQITAARKRHPEPLRVREAWEQEIARAEEAAAKMVTPAPSTCALEIRDAPVYARAFAAYAVYEPPAPLENDRAGLLLVVAPDFNRGDDSRDAALAGHDFASLATRVVRETWPGRHVAACASFGEGSRLRRLAANPVTREGWALEAERLMLEAGFFTSPAARLLWLRDRLEAALQSAIDVGLHTAGLDRADAVSLLTGRALASPAAAVLAVRRAALEPGRALGAMIGSDLIGELREEERARAGAGFDPAAFHGALLRRGALPLMLVREELNASR